MGCSIYSKAPGIEWGLMSVHFDHFNQGRMIYWLGDANDRKMIMILCHTAQRPAWKFRNPVDHLTQLIDGLFLLLFLIYLLSYSKRNLLKKMPVCIYFWSQQFLKWLSVSSAIFLEYFPGIFKKVLSCPSKSPYCASGLHESFICRSITLTHTYRQLWASSQGKLNSSELRGNVVREKWHGHKWMTWTLAP